MEDRSERTPLLVPGQGGNNQGAGAGAARASVAPRLLALGAMCVATLCVAYGTANVGTILQSKQGQGLFGRSVDPLVPKYFPLNSNNVITNVHTLNVPTTGADAAWDANFLANTASMSGIDPATLLMREVVYEIHTNVVISGVDCKDHETMHLFEQKLKSVASTPAVTVELCMPAKDVPGSYSVPTSIGYPRTAAADPSAIMNSLATWLMAPGALGTNVVVSQVSPPTLTAVAVIEGPSLSQNPDEAVASPPPAFEFIAYDDAAAPQPAVAPEPAPASGPLDDEVPEHITTDEDLKKFLANRPPHPEGPPVAPAPVVTAASATTSANQNPSSFIPLPAPLTVGNDVTAVPATNIPEKGFSDVQIELVKNNKARNAKMDGATLTVRAFYYTVYGEFNVTNSHCTEGAGPNGYRAVIQHALMDGFAEVQMSAKPDATDSQHCINMGMDELHTDAPFTENNYLVATDRAHLTTDLQTFAKEVVGVIHDAAFYTVLQHAIKEETGNLDHTGSDIEIVKESPKLIGFIVIEGPPGSAEKLQKSNGPIF